MKKKIVLIFVLLLAFCISPQVSEAAGKPTVILDPGHGGKYGGTAGYSGSRTGYYEKHANVEVSNRLKKALEKRGFKVILTRTADKEFSRISASVDLRERMRVANGFAAGNNDNSVFISVHHNATSSPTYGGYETYFYDSNYPTQKWPADPMQTHYSPESKRLAAVTHNTIISSGVKEGRGIVNNSLYVTRSAQMPSLLMEVGYMSNPTEERMIKTASFQQKIADNMAKGIDKFFDVYVVNDAKGKALKHFNSKTDAIKYGKKIKSSTVIHKKTGKTAGDPPAPAPLVYGVYHSSVAMKNNLFATEKEATDYAKAWKNTRVVNLKSKSVLWSNYLPQKYSVRNGSEKELKRFYQEEEAIAYAGKQTKASVIDTSTSDILWSNFKRKNFVVRSKDKGEMTAFYNREEARSYMNLWANTELYDIWGKKVIDTSSNTKKYTYSPKDLYAKDRLRTAIEVSKQLYPNGFASGKSKKTVVIATSHEYADALSAGPLAAHYDNAPILLNKKDKLSEYVEAELKRLKADHVIMVGGTLALSTSVESKLKSMGLKVERLSGGSRYETNAKINSKLPDSSGVLVASGSNYPDALTAASVAVVKNWPIVLVHERVDMPARLSNAFGDEVAIVGGTLAVPVKIENELAKRLGADNVERLSGKSRYDTSIAVIEHYKEDFTSSDLIVSVGTNYPDALVSSSLSERYRAPLFLVKDNSIPSELKDTMEAHSTEKLINRTFYIGGTITDNVKSSINGMQK